MATSTAAPQPRCAGVLVVGNTAHHYHRPGTDGAPARTPAALLGGRYYRRRRVYEYCDFGGSVDHGEAPHIAAFRELLEELFGLGCGNGHTEMGRLLHEATQQGRAVRAAAEALHRDADAAGAFVGAPAVAGETRHSQPYLQLVVQAEAVLATLRRFAPQLGLALPPGAPAAWADEAGRPPPPQQQPQPASAIDVLFAAGVRNDELTSLALLSVEELLRGAAAGGAVSPLAVRELGAPSSPGTEGSGGAAAEASGGTNAGASTGLVDLRGTSRCDCMVGPGGSVAACAPALRAYAQQQQQQQQQQST